MHINTIWSIALNRRDAHKYIEQLQKIIINSLSNNNQYTGGFFFCRGILFEKNMFFRVKCVGHVKTRGHVTEN